MKSKFIQRWAALLSIIFSPGFFLSAGTAGLTLFLSIYYKSNVPLSNTMAVVGSIFGGVAGAFLKDAYDHISNKNILEKKGTSALRNLEGIQTQLASIERWLALFRKKAKRADEQNTLDEIARHISTIHLNITAGLEDWEDIVPELKEGSEKEAAIEQKYKDALESVTSSLLETRKELARAKDKEIGKELKKKITDLEKQVLEIKKDRDVASHGLLWGNLTTEPVTLTASKDESLYTSNILGAAICSRCGKQFVPNMLSADSFPINSYDHQCCDECKKN